MLGYCLVQRPGRRVPAGDVRQLSGLRLRPLCQGLQGPGAQANPNQLNTPRHQRQSRTLYPDPLPRMRLRYAVPELRGTQAVAAPLPFDP
jgi:hypothetical protein